MERADGILRLASTHFILSLDKDTGGSTTWRPVLEIFTDISEKDMSGLESDTQAALSRMLLDASNPNSLRVIVNKARENARGAQDHITKEVWEEINQLYHLVNQDSMAPKLDNFLGLEVMEPLIRHIVAYTGLIDITMPRGTGWAFMNLGKYIERCLQTIAFTEKQIETTNFRESDTNDILQWRYLLYSLSGYELHLKTYRTSNHNYNVLHQVLINENFTRSVLYSLQRTGVYLGKVVKEDPAGESGALLRSFGRLFSKVKYMELDTLNNSTISTFLEDVKSDLLDFNKKVVQYFFSYY